MGTVLLILAAGLAIFFAITAAIVASAPFISLVIVVILAMMIAIAKDTEE